ncbi:hypothetical protein ACFL4E_03920, partial [Candidatus Omnitrophota bacterium]
MSRTTVYYPRIRKPMYTSFYDRNGKLYSRTFYRINGTRRIRYYFINGTYKTYRIDRYDWRGRLSRRELFWPDGKRRAIIYFNTWTGKKTVSILYNGRGRFTQVVFFSYYTSGNLESRRFWKPRRDGVNKIVYYDDKNAVKEGMIKEKHYTDGRIIRYEYWEDNVTIKKKTVYDNQAAYDIGKAREVYDYDRQERLTNKRIYTHEDVNDWLYDCYYKDYTYDILGRLIKYENVELHVKLHEITEYVYYGDTEQVKTKSIDNGFRAGIRYEVFEYYESGNLKSYTGRFGNGDLAIYKEYKDENWQGSGIGRIVKFIDYDGTVETYEYWFHRDYGAVTQKNVYDSEDALARGLAREKSLYDKYTGKIYLKRRYTREDINDPWYMADYTDYTYDILGRLVVRKWQVVGTRHFTKTVYEYWGDTEKVKTITTTDDYFPPAVWEYYESGLLKEHTGYQHYYEKHLDEDNDGDGVGRLVELVECDGTRHVYSDHFEGSDQYKHEKVYDVEGNLIAEYEYNESGTCIFRRDYEYIEYFSDYMPVAEYTYYDSGNLKTKKTGTHPYKYLEWPSWETCTYMDEDFYGDGTGRMQAYELRANPIGEYGHLGLIQETYTEYWEGTNVAKKMHAFIGEGTVYKGEHIRWNTNRDYTFHSSGLVESTIEPDCHVPVMHPPRYFHYMNEDWNGTGQGRMDIEIIGYPPDSELATAYS